MCRTEISFCVPSAPAKLQVTKLLFWIHLCRFNQGTGDPAGFKHFLMQKNIRPGMIVRYVGNRLHILFHVAGIYFSMHDHFTLYLASLCACNNSLRTSLLADLLNPVVLLQLRALGLLGKIITGPWMVLFYANQAKKTHLEMVFECRFFFPFNTA